MKSERSTQTNKRSSCLEHEFLTSVILQFSVFIKGIVKADPFEEFPEVSEKQTINTKQKVNTGMNTPPRTRPAPIYEIDHKKNRNKVSRKSMIQEESSSSPSQEIPSQIPSIEEIYPEGYKQKPKPPPKIAQDESEQYHAVSPKKARRKRNRHRDPNRTSPKKPVSSFVHFYAARAKQLRRDHPEGVVGNLAKILSGQWKVLPEKEKQPFIRAAEQSLQTYYDQKRLEKQALKQKYIEEKKNIQRQERQSRLRASRPIEHDLKPIAQKKPEEQKEPVVKPVFQEKPEVKTVVQQQKNDTFDVDYFPGGTSNNIPVSRFNMFFRSNYGKFENDEQKRKNLEEAALEEWRKLTSQEKKIYGNMAKAEKRKLEKIQMQQIQFAKKDCERAKRRRNGMEQDEYRPSLYRKSRSKASPVASKSQARPERKDNQSEEDEPHLFNFQIEPRDVKLEPDRSCQLRNYMEDDFSAVANAQNNMDMIDEQQSENYQENKIKNRDKLPPHFIEVNSNDDIQFFQNNLKDLRKKERRATYEGVEKREKNPVSAFLLYYHDILNDLQAANSKIQGSELVKLASSKWNDLIDCERKYYVDLAKQYKVGYDPFPKSQEQSKIQKRNRRSDQIEEL